ncbi:MFS transporter [Sphingomonas faeni]|uniref:MFS transporter n=1 Tax=Sphingomonas faeni TaxID=185950 RepID=UPI0027D7E110|nr:MFS transporter [Sphingomonas faeni]
MPNSLAVLGDAFSGEERGRAIGTWASVGAIAGAIGPPLGGWLVETVGWRGIFLINVPVAAVAVLLALRFVKESGQGKQALDWLGAVLATAALGSLTWALTRWSAGHGSGPVTLLTAVAGAALLVVFLLHEQRRGERAMMPLSMLASKPFVGLTVATLLLYGALGGVLVLLPFMLISAVGYSPFQAGLALLPLPVGIGVASRLMGRVTAKAGPRLPLTIGPVVTGIGFALLVLVEPADGYWASVFPGVAVIALGMAGAVAPLTTAVLSSVDARHTGTASGFNSAIARTGGLIATALVGAVMPQVGTALLDTFHHAVLMFAVIAVASGVASFLTLGPSAEAKTG